MNPGSRAMTPRRRAMLIPLAALLPRPGGALAQGVNQEVNQRAPQGGAPEASRDAASPSAPPATPEESFPDRPLQMIVPYVAGGAVDILGRLLAEQVQPALGQPVQVENRGGLGGNLGAEAVVRAPKDGYRLLLGSATILAANRFLYRRSMSFDPLKDLAPITRVASGTLVLVVRADRSWKSFADLIAAAKAAPGKITMGSSGTGTASHLTLAALQKATGVDITHVPYRGGALAIRDLLVGNVDMMFDVAPAILPHLRSGEFRALAVGSARRVTGVPELRDVPSMEELLPGSGIDAQAWYAVLTTAGTAPDRIGRLFAAFTGLVRSEAFRDRVVPEGLTPVWDDSPATFAAYLQTQTEYWHRLVEASGATLD